MKILFTGGGTGGHVFPLIAISRELKKAYLKPEEIELYYIGPRDEFSVLALTQEGINVKTVSAGKIRRYFTALSFLQNIADILFRIPFGFLQAFLHIFFLAPDVILSKGGYGSIPAVIAGWLLQVPIFIHESDITPGYTNRFLSRFAKEIFVSFPVKEMKSFPAKKMISTGNPIRPEIIQGSAEEAKQIFSLTGARPVILVIGGSQGAKKLNEIILQLMPDIFSDVEIIHQTGSKNFNQVSAEANAVIPKNLKRFYHPYSFLSEVELRHAYKVADLIISRAGSGSIFEIAANAKPSILIPLPESAQNHQLKNAYSYADKKAGLVIEDSNLSPNFFLGRIKYLLANQTLLKEMGERAKDFSRINAAKVIAQYLLAYLG